MSRETMPAEAFPVAAYLRDEMRARRWTAEEVAQRMKGQARRRSRASRFPPINAEYVRDLLDPEHHLRTIDALRLSRAFGVSVNCWLACDAFYWHWRAAQPSGPTT